MDYFLVGTCMSCGERVWVNLDGTCAKGHPDTDVSALEVSRPESLHVDELIRLMHENEDKRWVEGSNLVDLGKPQEAYSYLSELEPSITNPVDLHFVYNGLIKATYKLRDLHENWLLWCIEYCKRDIALFPRMRSAWLSRERLGSLFLLTTNLLVGDRKGVAEEMRRATAAPAFDMRVPSFQQLAVIYEKQGRIPEAIEVVELAISYGLHDGTQGDFVGRASRVRKKIAR